MEGVSAGLCCSEACFERAAARSTCARSAPLASLENVCVVVSPRLHSRPLLCFEHECGFPGDVVTKPNRSLITQSFDARERVTGNGYLNGDGFGVGWYPFSYEGSVLAPDLEETPGLFTSVKPAWNNENLRRLADKVGWLFLHSLLLERQKEIQSTLWSCLQ